MKIQWGCIIASLALLFMGDGASAAENKIQGTIELFDSAGIAVADRSGFVVFLEGQDPQSRRALDTTKSSPTTTPKISHKGMSFNPRILTISVGSEVDFLNDDRIFHNAFSVSRAKPFDLGIYPEGESKLVRFDESGLVRVYCNIHPDMVTNILVLENTYYTITDKTGAYKLDNVPNGIYRLRVWAEHANEAQRTVRLINTDLSEGFTLTKKRQFNRHKNKFGKPYRNKY